MTATPLTDSFISELNKRHEDIVYAVRKTVTNCIELGGLLVQAKGNLEYGDWRDWVVANLKYSIRTAQRYMLMYDQREAISAQNINEITDAYKLIGETPLKVGAAVTRTSQPEPEDIKPVQPKQQYAATSPLRVRWNTPRGEFKDGLGREVPQSIESAWRAALLVQELMLVVSRVRSKAKAAQDAKDPLWAEVSVGDVVSRLDTVYYALQTILPYAVCPYCQGIKNADCTFCAGRGFISEARWNGPIPEELKRIAMEGGKE